MVWSRHYAACVSCTSTKYKHYGHGLCKQCYQTQWSAANANTLRAYKHNWYTNSKDRVDYKEKNRRQRNGDFAVDLLSAGAVCANCGTSEKLHVHHKDHLGHNVPKALRNNAAENIQILCDTCHGRLHGSVDGWSRKYAACRHCGRTDRKHQAKGYCTGCYWRIAYYGEGIVHAGVKASD